MYIWVAIYSMIFLIFASTKRTPYTFSKVRKNYKSPSLVPRKLTLSSLPSVVFLIYCDHDFKLVEEKAVLSKNHFHTDAPMCPCSILVMKRFLYYSKLRTAVKIIDNCESPGGLTKIYSIPVINLFGECFPCFWGGVVEVIPRELSNTYVDKSRFRSTQWSPPTSWSEM